MSVDQPDVVDIISASKSGEIVLSISDHLDWTDTHGHLLVLQEKINRYLSFLESGEVYQRYPDAPGRKMTIKVVSTRNRIWRRAHFLQRHGSSRKPPVLVLNFNCFRHRHIRFDQ
jgi:hypothetical protein